MTLHLEPAAQRILDAARATTSLRERAAHLERLVAVTEHPEPCEPCACGRWCAVSAQRPAWRFTAAEMCYLADLGYERTTDDIAFDDLDAAETVAEAASGPDEPIEPTCGCPASCARCHPVYPPRPPHDRFPV